MLKTFFYWLSIVVLKITQVCLFPMKVYGRENVPSKGPFILASNHFSHLDPILIPVSSPRRLNFVAKEELFENKWFGKLLSTLGAFPVKRGQTDMSSIREMLRRLKTQPVLIFPEGTRARPGVERKIQQGVGLLVKQTNLPVVPVYITGTDKVLPPGTKKLNRYPVTITFGKSITFGSELSREAISYGVLQKIYELK
ncbi:MAG: 1-acyl-sn-glycerol-3-phosphate acyltransferase [Candidatus Omnitrophica bacterium]|nr:1-acyl-sn-glycerol-3-phosphate acyltransferase [Candidatus Omnitrophota bacterium]